MTSGSRKAYDHFLAGFTNVLFGLQEEGVDLHTNEAPEKLGLTKEEFNKHALASAKAWWNLVAEWKTLIQTGTPDSYEYLYEYVWALPTIHESLEITGADLLSDSGFSTLDTTKVGFEIECREAALTVLQRFASYAAVSESGGEILAQYIKKCMELGQLDPEGDTTYQAAGFESYGDFHAKLENWKQMAAEKAPQSCCGAHPAPGS